MPTYEYACAKCGQHFDVFQSFSDKPFAKHEGCGGKLNKVLGSVGIVLKGSGFYKTDSRAASRKSAAQSSESQSSESQSSESQSSESKSSESGGSDAKPSGPSGPKKTDSKSGDSKSSGSSSGGEAKSA